jgi:hypothetical protein
MGDILSGRPARRLKTTGPRHFLFIRLQVNKNSLKEHSRKYRARTETREKGIVQMYTKKGKVGRAAECGENRPPLSA